MSKKPRLYWDSNCFIALFNAEPTTSAECLTAIETAFEDMLCGRVRIVTSTLFKAEVFDSRLANDAERIYSELMACRHFDIVEVRSVVFELAGTLRQRCNGAGQSLKTPDALHIAAGSLVGADEIWSTDDKLVKKSESGLLVPTPVCLPYVNQIRLPM